MSKINVLDFVESPTPAALAVIRLGQDETPLIFFTADAEQVHLHYCEEPEIRGYSLCPGQGCLLCRLGRKADSRLLIPAYSPTEGAVGVLPVSTSLRPFALLPQIAPLFRADKPLVAFVRRDSTQYRVSTQELGPHIEAGEAEIRRFMTEYAEGALRLAQVFPQIDPALLASVPQIARLMALKGVTLGD